VAKVTVTHPEPIKLPAPVVNLELTYREALAIAVLTGNSLSRPSATNIYFAIHKAGIPFVGNDSVTYHMGEFEKCINEEAEKYE
jgi:hypothetical protein